MYTQCPHCLTLFRISSVELKVAAGKARCCQCNQVFNALETLQESPVLRDPAAQGMPTDSDSDFAESVTEDSLFADTLNLEAEQLIELTAEAGVEPDTGDDSFTIIDDGLETEPDYLAAGSESQMSALLDSESNPLIDTQDDTPVTSKVVPLNQPAGADESPDTAPSVQLTQDSSQLTETPESIGADSAKNLFHFTERQKLEDISSPGEKAESNYPIEEIFEKQPFNYKGLIWGGASLLLILILLLQLSWLFREQLIQYESGQQLLSQVCNMTGCVAPVRRDTSRIQVQHRDLRGHPSKANALVLQLNMVNRADFAQPYPKLHLSLFNDHDKLIAQRTFEPTEYLSDPKRIEQLMQQAEPVFIKMELLDPGKDVTGFKFEFL
ncbi:MAG: zinc-ribbon and DUF3426 domain-containing protein [Gammaproteobacteria bacterium]|nr:zinc-ribbon and DUF3426 domain-containing protein [Gammaproteobacteria bacterium]